MKILRMTSMLNPSVCSLKLAATSPFRGDINFLTNANFRKLCTSQQILDTNHKKIYNKKLSVSQISVRNATCDIELASDSLTNKLDAVH